MVMRDGVEMMLLSPSLRNAWRMAAKFVPEVGLKRPIANVAPVPMAEATLAAPDVAVVVDVVADVVPRVPPKAAAARSTMPVPEEPGKLVMAAGTVLLPCPYRIHCTPRLERLLTSTSTIR